MKKWIVRFFLVIVVVGLAYYFFPERKLPSNIMIDELVVVKSERVMYAYSKGKIIKAYKISLGREPLGDKIFQVIIGRLKEHIKLMTETPTQVFTKTLAFHIRIMLTLVKPDSKVLRLAEILKFME